MYHSYRLRRYGIRTTIPGQKNDSPSTTGRLIFEKRTHDGLVVSDNFDTRRSSQRETDSRTDIYRQSYSNDARVPIVSFFTTITQTIFVWTFRNADRRDRVIYETRANFSYRFEL